MTRCLTALTLFLACNKPEPENPNPTIAPAETKATPAPSPPPSPPPATAPTPVPVMTDEPDPHAGKFTIEEATAGLPKKGKLVAKIHTSMGTFTCELYEKKTPNTVANFVGLARGLRAFKDPTTGKWEKRAYYEGIQFHRVIPNFMIQGGDPTGTGRGGPGYEIPDEFDETLRHSAPGILSMANKGPNTGSGQFFIIEKPQPGLDNKHAVFGRCTPADLVGEIARVPTQGSRPVTPVVIEKIEVTHK